MSSNTVFAKADDAKSRTKAPSKDDEPFIAALFAVCMGAIVYLAWAHRKAAVVIPESGIGYGLGILGSCLMLVLLLYPLRKRVRALRAWGTVATWFRLHMVLGIFGPVLIVVHSDFTTKSLNASVALYSMLIVAASGVVGRYIYARIHRGLYGGKLEARELIAEAGRFREDLGLDLKAAAWSVEFAALEQQAMEHAHGIFGAVSHAMALNAHASRSENALRKDFEAQTADRSVREDWSGGLLRQKLSDGRARIRRYHAAVRKVGALGVYERLFGAWHVLHLPLFYMLIATALIHVVAVHLY